MTFAPAAWRDHDHDHRKVGLVLWLTGGEISLGKRLYRIRWVLR